MKENSVRDIKLKVEWTNSEAEINHLQLIPILGYPGKRLSDAVEYHEQNIDAPLADKNRHILLAYYDINNHISQ